MKLKKSQLNQIIQEELTKMLNEQDWRQPIAGHEPHSMSHTAAWLAQHAADLKGRLAAEYDLGGGEATFVPLETRTHLGADVDARNAQRRADLIAQLQGEDVPIRWPTPRSEPHPERRKILVQADSPSAQARFSPYRSEFRDLSTQEKIAGGTEATARPRAQFSPEELAAVGVTPDEWAAAGMRENLQRVIQEELEAIINEKSVSKSQQRFMGMVHKCKETGDCASEEVRKAAKSMKSEDAEDFASTKHKGLPEKKKKAKRKKS